MKGVVELFTDWLLLRATGTPQSVGLLEGDSSRFIFLDLFLLRLNELPLEFYFC